MPTTARPPKPRFTLTLQAEPDASDPKGVRRLRMALKRLGRQFGLRCVSVLPETEDASTMENRTQANTRIEASNDHA